MYYSDIIMNYDFTEELGLKQSIKLARLKYYFSSPDQGKGADLLAWSVELGV